MGIASFAPSTALEAVTGFPTWATIITVGCVSTFYTFLGGMKAVVWTDVFQAVVMLAGILAIVIQGTMKVGGMHTVWRINEDWHRIEFWDADFNPTTRHSIWSLVVGGSIQWMSIYGCNQASVQRYCAVPTLRKAKYAVLLNIGGVFLLILCTCLAGIVMFAYYAQQGCDPLTSKQVANANQLIPYFVMEVLGYPGLPGLFVSCLFSGALSTMSSCLNALAAVTWEDIFKPVIGHKVTERVKTWISKGLVLVYGAAGVGFAFIAQTFGGTVLQASISFTGAASGPLLGIFLLGGLFPWANWQGCVVGGILGLAFPLWISVGAYGLPSSGYKLDFPTANCSMANVTMVTTTAMTTTTTATVTELSGVQLLYTVSYLWYPSIGMATVIVVGLFVSLVTGWQKEEVDPKYLIPFFDRLVCCLPEKWRALCRCGYQFKDPEVLVHDQQEIVITKEDLDEQKNGNGSIYEKTPVTYGKFAVTPLGYKPSTTPHFVASQEGQERNLPFSKQHLSCTKNETFQAMKSTKDSGDTLTDGDSSIDDANVTTPFANNDKDEFRTGIHWARSEGIGRSAGWAMNIPKRLIVTALLGMGVPLIHATRTNVGTLAEMMLDERSIETEDVKLNVSLV
ncbi:hypothetical protein DPMN_156444 [Dreissena polymorpha]|uniref:Sodium-coupled monocarboxylate transporter 2 n=1 Tax=Dreissena polymorpha TaxID=45954 RepID=A0A9D4JCD5_DREPO|nr:hypothetical protein DPMN_156444 [Dreissena polymorpha]